MPHPRTGRTSIRPKRSNHAYQDLAQALRRQAQRTNEPCWICGQPIDWNADYRSPLSFTADHVHQLKDGGDIRGALKPAHRSCNAKRGNAKKPATTSFLGRLHTSRNW